MNRLLLAAGSTLLLVSAVRGGVVADQVVGYTPGDLADQPSFNSANAAVGTLNGDTTFGGLNPFNPPFDPGQIVIVGPGGQLTLHLSDPVPANGRTLGVFANNGLVDVSPGGTGQAGTPASTFSPPPQAIVSVSQDGTNFVPLNGGAPVTFANPTNYYLDQPINGFYQNLGAQVANQSKPFLGTLSDFSGKTYSQMKSLLNGSAGGTWVDLSGTGLPAVNYVRFFNPAGSDYRTVVDAVSGMEAARPIVAGQAIISESVGSGANTSHLVLDFGPQSYEFEVHYDGSITGEQALQLLQSGSAFRFGIQSYSFGDVITSMDYGGYVDANSGSNYWSYYLSTDGSNWNYSGQGASSRLLTDGAWDGWVWTGAQSTPPDQPIAAPEPASVAFFGFAGLLLLRRRR